jgi:type VI secretion system protein ImpC
VNALRILVIADLSGRRNAGRCDPPGLASRAIAEVDIDSFDRVLARTAPRLMLPSIDESAPEIALSFAELDAFTPDRLYRDLELFSDLRAARERPDDLQTLAQTASRPAAAGKSAAPSAPVEDNPATLERLLGRPLAPGGASSGSPVSDKVRQLLHRIVSPHVVAGPHPHRDQYLAAVDAAIGERIRAILHHPDFQCLEATWRSVHSLVTSLELGEQMTLCLLDASHDELAADLAGAAGDPEASALYRRLAERETETTGGDPWSLIVGDLTFGAGADDGSMLYALGAIAARIRAPVLAAADCSLLGCRSLAETPDPRDWTALDPAAEQRWQALRKSPVARWIGLALPRVLLRLPYGARAEAVEAFDFDELAGGRRHEHYLWGNPAYACARLIGASFAEAGWDTMPDTSGNIDDLPAHTWSEDGESRMQPCAEALIGERGSRRMLERGLIPLLSHRGRNAVRVVRIASIADQG